MTQVRGFKPDNSCNTFEIKLAVLNQITTVTHLNQVSGCFANYSVTRFKPCYWLFSNYQPTHSTQVLRLCLHFSKLRVPTRISGCFTNYI